LQGKHALAYLSLLGIKKEVFKIKSWTNYRKTIH
jgi:hypothetical protein